MTWAGVRSWLRRRWWIIYLALLVASLMTQAFSASLWTPTPALYEESFEDEPTWAGVAMVDLPVFCEDGPVGDRRMKLSVLEWRGDGWETRPPIILLHGSPGQAYDWTRQAPMIAEAGYRVLAVDRMGFGNSTGWLPCYSARANARSILALMDAWSIDRAHIVGWSHSGLVALNMADIDDRRLASLTMMGATGEQRVEGSGSHFFEHAKYAVGYVVGVIGVEALPHFGVLDRKMRHAFIRDFWDTDQRPLTEVIELLQVPTLILQGRHDPLVPVWAAEEHHRMMPASRIVIANAGHLVPFYDPDLDATWMLDHFQRHDEPGVVARTDSIILVPETVPAFGRVGQFVVDASRHWPWVALVLLIAACYLVQPELTAVVCAALVARVDLDFGVAFVGLTLGGLIPLRRARAHAAPAPGAQRGLVPPLCAPAAHQRDGQPVPARAAPRRHGGRRRQLEPARRGRLPGRKRAVVAAGAGGWTDTHFDLHAMACRDRARDRCARQRLGGSPSGQGVHVDRAAGSSGPSGRAWFATSSGRPRCSTCRWSCGSSSRPSSIAAS